ncbi:MAG TPA: hypothetical protein DCE71_01555 [Parachlamydiales bacterium]|nr:hypothetical protein [Parachlamydiales bacterium]
MRFVVFFGLLIFSSACQYVEEPPNTKAAMEKLVLSDTVRCLKADKELYACGWGGQGKDKIQMLALSFFYHEPVKDIEKGRDLLVSAIQRFIGEIDKEKRLHKYLEKNPFPPGSIEIRIFIQDVKGHRFSPGHLTVLTFVDGILTYKMAGPEPKELIIIGQETYEEALTKWNLAHNEA